MAWHLSVNCSRREELHNRGLEYVGRDRRCAARLKGQSLKTLNRSPVIDVQFQGPESVGGSLTVPNSRKRN